MSDYNSSFTAEQIEDKLQGLIVCNDEQTLTEAQKAQARANIGAGTSSSGLQIIGYFDTYEELVQTVTRPGIGSSYAVGTQAPYNIYIWDSLNRTWVSNGNIRGADGRDAVLTPESISTALGYTPLSNASSAVKSANIASSAVTNTKLGTGAVTSVKIGANAVSVLYSGTLSPGAWSSGEGYYVQNVTVTGVLTTDTRVLVDMDAYSISGFENKKTADEEWGNIFYAKVSADNTLQVFSRELTTLSIPIKVICIRK